mmetsp:Transcript_31226/g.45760  ORF Transcript_31226/g.45760 Transcript_31226/m.45760 type:complete len:100 (+) Transcript_31226:903-1202(+)
MHRWRILKNGNVLMVVQNIPIICYEFLLQEIQRQNSFFILVVGKMLLLKKYILVLTYNILFFFLSLFCPTPVTALHTAVAHVIFSIFMHNSCTTTHTIF